VDKNYFSAPPVLIFRFRAYLTCISKFTTRVNIDKFTEHPLQIPELVRMISEYLDWFDYIDFRPTNSTTMETLSGVYLDLPEGHLIDWDLNIDCSEGDLDCIPASLEEGFKYPELTAPAHKTHCVHNYLGSSHRNFEFISSLIKGLYNNLPPNGDINQIEICRGEEDIRVILEHYPNAPPSHYLPEEEIEIGGVSLNWNEIVQTFQQKNVRLLLLQEVEHEAAIKPTIIHVFVTKRGIGNPQESWDLVDYPKPSWER